MAIEAAKLMVTVGVDTATAEAKLRGFSGALTEYGNRLTSIGTRMTAFLTVPLVLAGRQVVNTALQYGEAMNILGSVTRATGDEMSQFDALAQALGRDLTLPATSASDAASAMVELAKAGLTTTQTMAAVKGVLQLSAAGNISNARAAEVAANSLNMFNLNAAETTRVADLLAAAANASSAEIEDVADALQMSGAVYASAGVPIENLTAMISEMANAGIKGSDSGTSLKQMLLSLQAPTDKAAKLMQQYGIDIYDAQGKLLPMAEIIDAFSTQLGGLSDETRNAALATIFGSDAVRAANVVLMGGVEAYDKMTQAVTDQGAASRLAEARMQGLNGKIENMKSAIETASLALGEAVADPVTKLAEAVTGLANGFSDLDPKTQEFIGTLGIIALVSGPAISTVGQISSGVGGMLKVLPGAIIGLKDFGAAFSLLAGAKTVGEGLSVATLGMSGVAAVAAPVAAAIASVAGVILMYNKAIVQTNKAGQALVSATWTKFFDDQAMKGSDAITVLSEYEAAQQRIADQMKIDWSKMSLFSYLATGETDIAKLFMNRSDMAASVGELNLALAQASTTYAEYRGVVAQSSVDLDVFTQAEWMAAQSLLTMESTTATASTSLNDLAVAAVEAGDTSAASLKYMQEAAQTTYGDLQSLVDQTQTLKDKMADWVSGTASEAAGLLGQYLPESSQRYQTALGGLDEIMGTNYLTQYNLTQSLKDLVAEYSRTGDIDAFKDGLTKIKEDGLAGMKAELENVTRRAQDLYDKLLHLPQEIRINIGFDVEDLPDWILQGQGVSMGGGRVGVGMYNQRATGGPGWAGQMYQVNERQKIEYFIPSVNGRITPIAPEGKQMADRGDIIVNANVQNEMDWYSVAATIRTQALRGEL